jgi:hypothetical protein
MILLCILVMRQQHILSFLCVFLYGNIDTKEKNTETLIEASEEVGLEVNTLYPQKLAPTSPTSGGRSVGIVCSQTQAMEFLVFFFYLLSPSRFTSST